MARPPLVAWQAPQRRLANSRLPLLAFAFETAEDIEAAFRNRKPAHTYSRISNPTVEDLEIRIRLLANAQAVIAVSSGMAAIANVIMAVAEAGSNIVTTRFLFGNTLSLFENTLGAWGLKVKYVDLSDLGQTAAAIDADTRGVFLETITNPQLQVVEIAKIGWAAD